MPMPGAAPLAVLLVNEQAEETKLAAITLRRAYPGCRVEAVYSAEEAIEWVSKQDWHVILLDDHLPSRSGLEILPELRRHAPHAAIIVQATHLDAAIVGQARQAGADHYLFKQSPAFLMELPFAAQEALEKHDLRGRSDLFERRACTIEGLLDLTYELDSEGRFVCLSRTAFHLLSYAQEELIGAHYSQVIHPADRHLADRRFNERRTGARASRHIELRLIKKAIQAEQAESIPVEFNASGLYDRRRRFMGTLGVVQGQHRLRQDQSSGQRRDVRPNEPAAEAQSDHRLFPAASAHREPGPSAPERRRSDRVALNAEARLSLNGTMWHGSVRNVSLGGLYMVFSGQIPATQNQPIQLGLISEVGVLEVQGLVRGVREAVGPGIAPPDNPALGLGVEFAALGTTAELVITSLLDGLREQTVSIKATAVLSPQETGDLLLAISSTESESDKRTAIRSFSVQGEPQRSEERRETGRVAAVLPVLIENERRSESGTPWQALTLNLSVAGACVRLQTRPHQLGHQLLLRLSPSPPTPPDSSKRPAQSPELTIRGQVAWMEADDTTPGNGQAGSPPGSVRIGLRFLDLNEDVQRRIAELAGPYLTSAIRAEERDEGARLVSESLECRNDQGQRLALYHDRPRKGLPPSTPLVIISPGYGETKKEYVTLAYYLASNGFHVLRYDHANHVGESDGDIQHSTLSSMRQDLIGMLDFAERTWPESPVAVVASSLSGRVALKALSKDRRTRLLVALTCVVDVQATLLAVHQEDHLSTYLHGARKGFMNVLGFNIDADRWLEDAIKEGYADLQSAIQDTEQIRFPVILFAAEHDAWVNLESLKRVHAALPSASGQLYLIPEALHRLQENPRKTRAVFRQIVIRCQEYFYPLSPHKELIEPSQREIGLQNRLERERAKAQHQMAKADNLRFWQDYLAQFHYIVNSSDYWHLLDHIYRLITIPDGRARILDAGCGNGNFGMFLLINQAYRERHAPPTGSASLHYIGADFALTGLCQAQLNLSALAAQSGGQVASSNAEHPMLVTSLCCADLNVPLPFRDNQFDCIVCNLVIGYLQDPLPALKELIRVLTYRGRLVLTNLKPYSDFSQIYRNFVQVARQPEEVEEARQVLNNSSRIKQGESDGIFRFFDRQELSILLLASGAKQPRIYSTFANQAYVAVTEKPDPAATHAEGMARASGITRPGS
jgi:PAS domain S-box-containing protein